MKKSKKLETYSNPRILVTYAWVRSSWAIIRNLARHGLEVYAGDKQKFFMSRFSRYCNGWVQYPDYRQYPEKFVDKLVSFIKEKDIGTYIPSHEEGFIVAKYRDKFPSSVKIPIAKYATIKMMDNKRESQKIAHDLGIPHPNTFSFHDRNDFLQQKYDLPNNGVIKKIYSHGSHGILFYTSLDELEQKWINLVDNSPEQDELPIVQEYIKAHIYAVTLLAKQGEVYASFARRNIREKEPFGGACVKCESVYFPKGVEYATQIVNKLNYDGVAMFEFLVEETKDDSQVNNCWLMEINPRYWGTTSHDIDCGVEYPFLQYCLANNILFSPFPEYSLGKKSRWIAGDVISFFKRYITNHKKELINDLKNYIDFDDDFFMDFKLDDPLPFFVQSYLYFKFRQEIFKNR